MPPNNAMQRSAPVVTPLATAGAGAEKSRLQAARRLCAAADRRR